MELAPPSSRVALALHYCQVWPYPIYGVNKILKKIILEIHLFMKLVLCDSVKHVPQRCCVNICTSFGKLHVNTTAF